MGALVTMYGAEAVKSASEHALQDASYAAGLLREPTESDVG